MSEALIRLQDWYKNQCNGEWEHAHGLTIGTLDNPGWTVEIDLKDTKWEKAEWKNLVFEHAPDDWINCSKKDSEYKGYGDANKLEVILNHFLSQVGYAG